MREFRAGAGPLDLDLQDPFARFVRLFQAALSVEHNLQVREKYNSNGFCLRHKRTQGSATLNWPRRIRTSIRFEVSSKSTAHAVEAAARARSVTVWWISPAHLATPSTSIRVARLVTTTRGIRCPFQSTTISVSKTHATGTPMNTPILHWSSLTFGLPSRTRVFAM